MGETRLLVDIGVVAVLGIMSVIALSIIFERYFSIRRTEVTDFSSLDQLENSLTEYLHLLASIGSNAPYVGMLGTVLGIMATFHEMGANGTNANGVMEALSSALFATALGLAVAIPTIFIYNLLLRSVKNKVVEWKTIHE
ncbi:MotA/TolQ/ExbB proton channel family protein [Sulfuricurvum sp.]|uniref:MotA/TolQ/ExbB proton channel family protein n=2 Tax=Sulfuricurvum sp. TaxID=2025608 RepID=UPI002627C550|nr:MotA/TolQ/ExbB proton channel family protein [Sulfuricurvum sp.]MDD2837516.1 MotA/TolQ/ExbB proton channel family protein [Sulfuricurvum sp.]MDD3595083.1 MotA/TolQ/ExbB proton channel family protein [Sulfuricurvum sp.]